MTKPTKITPAQADTMVRLRDQRAGWARKGYAKSCGNCTLGFNKEKGRWVMTARWNEFNPDGSYVMEADRPNVRKSFRTSHSIAFEGTDPDAMLRLNAHWAAFCINNN